LYFPVRVTPVEPLPEVIVRKEIARAVRQLFDDRMRQKLPQFSLFKDKGNRQVNPGTRVYRRIVSQDLYLFVMLQPTVKEPDDFIVVVAWSHDGVVPGVYPDLNGEAGDRFNLGKLWNARNSFHKWMLTNPPSQYGGSSIEEVIHSLSDEGEKDRIEAGLRQAPVRVDDAINRIVEYALPYFDTVIKTRTEGPTALPGC
jgi:hypothetical protein